MAAVADTCQCTRVADMCARAHPVSYSDVIASGSQGGEGGLNAVWRRAKLLLLKRMLKVRRVSVQPLSVALLLFLHAEE